MGSTDRRVAPLTRIERPRGGVNALAKRVKRVAFGITNWTHWRVRVLLYAGRPDWSKLATITPAAP